eukprot:jgi/Chlat1/3421/Chrsp23S00273
MGKKKGEGDVEGVAGGGGSSKSKKGAGKERTTSSVLDSSYAAAPAASSKDDKKGGGSKERKTVSVLDPNFSTAALKKEKGKDKKKDAGAAVEKKGAGGGYLGDMDLPPSDEEDDVEREEADEFDEETTRRREKRDLSLTVSAREVKKKEQKEMMAAADAERMKQLALQEDENAFSVALGKGSVGEDSASAMSRDIKITNFSVSARGKELLKNTSLSIVHGRRYGLVGPNGKGKSTLMKLLAKRQIPVPEYIDVLLVEQEVIGDERTALQAVVAADAELVALREEEAKLQAMSENIREDDADAAQPNGDSAEGQDDAEGHEDPAAVIGERLNEIYERMNEIGGEAAEAKASKILHGLGFTEAMQNRSTKSFSGGWRMRISLARALFMQPTLLLLDEPTNHLDLRAVFWLEEYLHRWKKTLVVVSHDRDFLNTVCTDIIHLHDQKLHFYRGNFDSFDEMLEQKRREVNKAFEKYEKQLKAAKATGSKASQDKVKASAKQASEKRAKSAKSKKGAQEEDEDDTAAEPVKKWQDYMVKFSFPQPTELPPPLMQLLDVAFSYPGREDFAMKDINVGVDMGTRVAIVGPNGAGKSTLLNLLAGDLTPSTGEMRRSHKLRIGRYSQHFVDVLTMDENPVQYLLRLHPDQVTGPSRQESMRSKLGKFGLDSRNHLTPIIKLSGGQKARVVFTHISLSAPHILLLDEPTNNLDMESIDALADALDEFEGGVVLVSHDSRLISRVCEDEERSEIWVVDDGTVTRFNGDFEEYRSSLMKEIQDEIDAD